ncbi:TOMM precursor leader peptide-binding protein, partial [Streptomyces mirabilis]|uniref:TOMM precursor leader peptide-binding protein n=1 Tax=Streptomyces mirabilis TaxID=68239 RepID=UPI003683501B
WPGPRPPAAPVPRAPRAGGPARPPRPPRRPGGGRGGGPGRVGVVLASLLAGAGVGQVEVRDIGSVEPWDVAPGGLPSASIGERREEAARRAVRRAAPDRPSRTAAEGEELGLSLVILAPRDGLAVHAPDPAVAEPLITSGTPHLYAGVVEGTGVVGPLVLPGDTGCAGCLDQQRIDRDPTWPRLIAQWRSGASHQVPACDLALATGVAGLAAGHALAFLDGRLPSSAGARWESSVPGFDWHAKPVWSHPACPCGAAEKSKKGERAAEDGQPHETMAGQQPHAARLSGTWRAHV